MDNSFYTKENHEINIMDLVNLGIVVLISLKNTIIFFLLFFLLIGFLSTSNIKPQYSSQSRLLIELPNINLKDEQNIDFSSLNTQAIQTEIEKIKSNALLHNVITKKGIEIPQFEMTRSNSSNITYLADQILTFSGIKFIFGLFQDKEKIFLSAHGILSNFGFSDQDIISLAKNYLPDSVSLSDDRLLKIIEKYKGEYSSVNEMSSEVDQGKVVDIYPTEDSAIKEIFVTSDQEVEKGDLLITMMSPSLSNKVDKAIERVRMIQQKLDRRIGSEADMSNLMVLENQLKVEFEILKSLKEENENLSIYAPMSGVIKDLKYLNNGQWVNLKEKLFSIVQFNDTKVVAFISENDLDKLEGNTSGYFVPKNNEFDEAEVVLVSQNNTSTEELPYLSLVSTFGGSIASREVKGDGKVIYRPEEALYQLNFSTITEVETVQWQTAGNVKIQSENYNIFQNLFNLVSSTLIRESGF